MAHNSKIMIVEDETLLAADLAESLRCMGYTVTSRIGSGEEALERIDAASPDLVLMDIQLGGKLDGIETAGKIRRLRDTPVVFMSAFSDESFLSRAKRHSTLRLSGQTGGAPGASHHHLHGAPQVQNGKSASEKRTPFSNRGRIRL